MNVNGNDIKFPVNNITLDKNQENLEQLCNSLIGRRIELNEYIGFVRYVGKLKHKEDPDIWAGIEWDDAGRGKHNGTVENSFYFDCKFGSGSLIKLSKLNFGLELEKAVRFKYNFDTYADEKSKLLNSAIEKNMYIESGKKKIEIEVVGKNKSSNWYSDLNQITFLDLSNSFITNIVFKQNQFDNLRDLTLTRTLLSKWSVLLKILNTYSLVNLNFSENVLEFDDEFEKEKEIYIKNNKKLKSLILNKSRLDFFILKKLEFIQKEELYLYGNYLNEKNFYDGERINLYDCEVLSLEGNEISNVAETLKKFNFDNLTSINLNNNYIENVTKKELESIQGMKKIAHLFLDWNKITTTKILFELEFFNNLKSLFITQGNPAFKEIGFEASIKLIIGRFLELKILNNNIILPTERKEYEKHYLKSIVNNYFKDIKPISKSKDFDRVSFDAYMELHHSTYFVLRKKFFDPVEDILWNFDVQEIEEKKKNGTTVTDVPSQKPSLKTNLVSITLQSKEKSVLKNLPKSTTFSTLRSLVIRLFKIDSFSFKITYDGIDMVIIDEGKSLEGYNILTDTTIFIE